MSRSREGERENVSGNEPARNDLNACQHNVLVQRWRLSRNGHDGAQGNEHEQSVQSHLDRAPARVLYSRAPGMRFSNTQLRMSFILAAHAIDDRFIRQV